VSFFTYAAGGVLLCALIGALANQHYAWMALGCAALGSWLPHLCKRPWLTLTHSLLGLAGCAVLLSPLLVCHHAVFWTALVIGYASHLLFDAGSDRGVRLFYPSRARAVIPRHPLSRVPPGSPREALLRRWLLGLWLVALPLNALGLRGLLHQLLPVIQFAVEDYETIAGQGRRVVADFTGHFTASQRPIAGRWEVLEAMDRTTLLVEDPVGHRYALGTHPHDTIQVLRIRARQGPSVDVQVHTIHLHEQLLSDLVPLLPSEGRTYLIGLVKTPEAVQPRLSVEEFRSVHAGSGQVELRYATAHDLDDQHLLGLYVTDGDVILRTLKAPGSHPTSSGDAPPAHAAPRRTITLIVRHLAGPQELLVHEGQPVTAGQPLMDLRGYRVELQAEMQVVQAQVAAADALVVALHLKQAQAGSLKRTEDTLMGVHRDLTAWQADEAHALAHAQAQAEAARAKLAKLEHALAATTIRAPARGRFLAMQYHPMTSTATLHLLADD